MKVIFAPDWRSGVPYQRLLSESLNAAGVEVPYIQGYRRAFPLYRGLRTMDADITHLHWPEAYWPVRGNVFDHFRLWRYPADIQLARLQRPIAYTLHNLWPHNTTITPGIERAVQTTLEVADVIFAHSKTALAEASSRFLIDPTKFVLIPHGDLSPDLGTPVSPDEARSRLNLDSRPIAFMFGRIEPYKGIEEIIGWWKENEPDAMLHIIGEPQSEEYAQAIAALAEPCPLINPSFRRLSETELGLWLSAVNCVIFNYRQILTSGAASLVRSWGTPLLLPARLQTVELAEPSPRVIRFGCIREDFGSKLAQGLSLHSDYSSAQDWRTSISWEKIADITIEAYRKILLDK